jgi:DNA-directed RNA polymerase subunit F
MRRENQQIFFDPIKKWLESHNIQCVITGGERKNLVIPIGDLIPTKAYGVPDIMGIRENQVVIVEVETKLEKIFEVVGKCMLWKTMATLVYAAYPLEKADKIRLFERLGIGLLGVGRDEVKEIVKIMPQESLDLRKIWELHPLDFAKEMELFRFIKNIIEGTASKP